MEKKAFPILGLMVVNGCAPVLARSSVVAALKKVDFPADGLPWQNNATVLRFTSASSVYRLTIEKNGCSNLVLLYIWQILDTCIESLKQNVFV
jgi:hypothetical protein